MRKLLDVSESNGNDNIVDVLDRIYSLYLVSIQTSWFSTYFQVWKKIISLTSITQLPISGVVYALIFFFDQFMSVIMLTISKVSNFFRSNQIKSILINTYGLPFQKYRRNTIRRRQASNITAEKIQYFKNKTIINHHQIGCLLVV